MKIYTRTGDAGGTGLFGGGRVGKDHPRVEAYGSVDELNAVVGRALVHVVDDRTRERLARVQHDLFAVGAHLSAPPPKPGRRRPDLPPFPDGRVGEMETWIDEADAELPPLRAFVLPGGSAGAAELHLCRTVCRRAERAVVALAGMDPADPVATDAQPDPAEPATPPSAGRAATPDPAPDSADRTPAAAIRYLNRLSDLLFALARLENARAGEGDVEWRKEEP